jgi:hypothetical protein
VLDARPQLGGRATAFRDRQTGELVDNGQHVLFGCYRETLAFLPGDRRIRSRARPARPRDRLLRSRTAPIRSSLSAVARSGASARRCVGVECDSVEGTAGRAAARRPAPGGAPPASHVTSGRPSAARRHGSAVARPSPAGPRAAGVALAPARGRGAQPAAGGCVSRCVRQDSRGDVRARSAGGFGGAAGAPAARDVRGTGPHVHHRERRGRAHLRPRARHRGLRAGSKGWRFAES